MHRCPDFTKIVKEGVFEKVVLWNASVAFQAAVLKADIADLQLLSLTFLIHTPSPSEFRFEAAGMLASDCKESASYGRMDEDFVQGPV